MSRAESLRTRAAPTMRTRMARRSTVSLRPTRALCFQGRWVNSAWILASMLIRQRDRRGAHSLRGGITPIPMDTFRKMVLQQLTARRTTTTTIRFPKALPKLATITICSIRARERCITTPLCGLATTPMAFPLASTSSALTARCSRRRTASSRRTARPTTTSTVPWPRA